MLEDKVYGPLYKLIFWKKRSVWHPGAAYPFSVSKINQYLSFFITTVWLLLVSKAVSSFLYWQEYFSSPIKIDIFWLQSFEMIFILIGTGVFACMLYLNARTDILCNLDNQRQENQTIIVKRLLPCISGIIVNEAKFPERKESSS